MPTIRCSEPYSCAQCGKAVVDVNMDSDSSMLRTLLSEEFSGFKFRESFFLMGAGLADFLTTTQRRRHQGCRPSAAQHLHQCVRIQHARRRPHGFSQFEAMRNCSSWRLPMGFWRAAMLLFCFNLACPAPLGRLAAAAGDAIHLAKTPGPCSRLFHTS